MSKPLQKSKRKRIYVSRKRYEKIEEYTKKEGLASVGSVIDELMKDFIEKENL